MKKRPGNISSPSRQITRKNFESVVIAQIHSAGLFARCVEPASPLLSDSLLRGHHDRIADTPPHNYREDLLDTLYQNTHSLGRSWNIRALLWSREPRNLFLFRVCMRPGPPHFLDCRNSENRDARSTLRYHSKAIVHAFPSHNPRP